MSLLILTLTSSGLHPVGMNQILTLFFSGYVYADDSYEKAFKKNSAVRNAIKRSPLYKGKKKKKSKKKRKKYPDLSNNPGPYFCACCAGLNLMQVTCERGSKM